MTDLRISGPTTGELLGGRYRIDECIGVGGMARVYRAEDTQLGRTVAIKLMHGALSEPVADERASAETAALAALNHHALVTLFDAHLSTSADESSYLVMEHVEGTTLRELVESGPLAPEELAPIAMDIAEGLHIAHDAGIVHRDIKPSNVLLTPSPIPGHPWRAKVADFGIAYIVDSARLTMPGLVIGTAAYIAPEQARGAAPAPPADVYSLGLMMLEALTGRRPFADAEGVGALTARLVRSPEIPEDLDETWRRLLRGMTAHRPEDRPTALEVATTLGAQRVGRVDRTAKADASAPPDDRTEPYPITPTGAAPLTPVPGDAYTITPAPATSATRTPTSTYVTLVTTPAPDAAPADQEPADDPAGRGDTGTGTGTMGGEGNGGDTTGAGNPNSGPGNNNGNGPGTNNGGGNGNGNGNGNGRGNG